MRLSAGITAGVLATLFIAKTVSVAQPVAAAQPELVNGIAVIVNQEVITYQEVKELIGPDVAVLENRYRSDLQSLQQRVLELQQDGIEQLVEHELILHDYETAGYNLPESIIDGEIERRIRNQFGDRLRMTRTLQARGLTVEAFRRQVREQIIVSQLRNFHVSSEIIISPHKIQRYYAEHKEEFKVEDSVKLRMIVINQPPDADPDRASNMAREILLKLGEGAPFTEMARIYSEGSQRGSGGDWGWVERSVLRKDLAEVAFSLEPGQRSGVIATDEACFIMLVEDQKTADVQPLAEVSEEIEKILLAEERSRLENKYIDRLKSKQFIRYF